MKYLFLDIFARIIWIWKKITPVAYVAWRETPKLKIFWINYVTWFIFQFLLVKIINLYINFINKITNNSFEDQPHPEKGWKRTPVIAPFQNH